MHHVIAEDLRAAIRTGALAPGDRVPSIRALGEQYGVSPQYAATALRTLATQGWIDVHRGRPSVVADTQPAEPTPAKPTPSLADLARRVEHLEELHSSDTPGHQHP